MPYADADDPRRLDSKRQHYEKNKDAYKARAKATTEAIRQLVIEAKNKPCADCGGEFPYYVMDLDHVPERGAKVRDPSKLRRYGSIRKAVEEIAKCDVVCSNCHRIRSFSRGQHLGGE